MTGLILAGLVIVTGSGWLALAQAPTGSPTFMAILLVQTAAYLFAAWRLATAPPRGQVLVVGLALALAARAPMVWMPELVARDAVRYVWDAQVQRAGLDPYATRPDDLAVAHLHTKLTHRVDAAWLPTIYPPVAQLYFRLVTSASESLGAFRVAAIAADMALTIGLAALLRATGQPAALSLIFAWHPVMIYEGAAGAHFDSAGALLLVLCLLGLTRQRVNLAAWLMTSAALVKPLPVVLLPLVWRRVRAPHVLLAALWAGLTLLVVTSGGLPVGSAGDFIDDFRFNAPAFRALAPLLGPRVVAALAVAAGALVAWRAQRSTSRRAEAGLHVSGAVARRPEGNVPDWAAPQAVALLLAPVIYPWYLAWVLPFAVVARSAAAWAWSVSLVAIYPTWWLAARGRAFEVPPELLIAEYAGAAVLAGVARRAIRETSVS